MPDAGRAAPAALLLPNDGDLTFAKVRLDERSRATALEHLPLVADPLARAVVWASLWDACRDAELPARDYVDVVLRTAAVETVPTQLRERAGAGVARRELLHRSGRAGRRAGAARGGPGRAARRGARGFRRAARVRPLVRRGDQPGLGRRRRGRLARRPRRARRAWSIDRDLRWLLVGQLARLGRIDEAGIDAEQARDNSSTGAELAAGARAARPTAEAKAEAWRLACETDEVTNSVQSAICVSFGQRGQDDVLAPYVEPYLAMVEDASALRGVWATKGEALRTTAVRNLFPVPDRPRAVPGPAGRVARRRSTLSASRAPDRGGAPRRLAARPALPAGGQSPRYGASRGSASPRSGRRGAWRRPSRSTGRRCSPSCGGSPCPGSRRTTARRRAPLGLTRTLRLAHGPAAVRLTWDGAVARAGVRRSTRPTRPTPSPGCGGWSTPTPRSTPSPRSLGADPHLADDVASSPGLRLPGRHRRGRGGGAGAGQPADLDGRGRALLGQADRGVRGRASSVEGGAGRPAVPDDGGAGGGRPGDPADAAGPRPGARRRWRTPSPPARWCSTGAVPGPSSAARCWRCRGSGPWTADVVGLRALGRRDVLLGTDLAVRRQLAGPRDHRPGRLGTVPQLRDRAPLAALRLSAPGPEGATRRRWGCAASGAGGPPRPAG